MERVSKIETSYHVYLKPHVISNSDTHIQNYHSNFHPPKASRGTYRHMNDGSTCPQMPHLTTRFHTTRRLIIAACFALTLVSHPPIYRYRPVTLSEHAKCQHVFHVQSEYRHEDSRFYVHLPEVGQAPDNRHNTYTNM
jgi:hypothetical protein